MDIHRCRFVPYPPHPINALAFSHPSDPDSSTPNSLRLALGRASGDIEIWNPNNGSWFQESILRGGKERSIEGLAWTQDVQLSEEQMGSQVNVHPLRLFSTGDSQSVTEWNLATGTPLRHADSNFGDIWCLAAQPQVQPAIKTSDPGINFISPSSQLLAAGCGDGTIVLFSTDEGDLRFSRTLGKPSTKKPKVLSITWRDRNTIVAGYDDSTIRVYDVEKRTTIRSISLGKSAEGGESYVWCVRCLKNGTILSGDSSGELKIWNARNYSLMQRLKTHDADILDIATSSTEDMIVTVGVDRRSVAYKPVSDPRKNKNQRWMEVMHRRFHQHDVKAIAAFESQELSVTITGGVDTVPVIAPLRRWQAEYHRSLPYLPQNPQLSSSKTRLILSWWATELLIWRLPKHDRRADQAELLFADKVNHELVAKILMQSEENITSAQLSQDGGFLIVATFANVKLFQLRTSTKHNRHTVKTRQIELPLLFRKFGARAVGFSPNGRWLYAVRPNNVTALAKLNVPQSADEMPEIQPKIIKLARKPRRSRSNAQDQDLGPYLRTVTRVAFSADSRILTTGDISGAVDVWLLEGHDSAEELTNASSSESDTSSDDASDSDSDDDGEDLTIVRGQKWIRNPAGSTLPQLGHAILAMAFRPQEISAVQSTNPTVGLHATRHNPHPVSHSLPTHNTGLVVITADHEVVEFDVLGCRLSDWTRRNPANCLPRDFTKIKDRVMDCFWDSGANKDRLWLYGPTWVFMLDMSQDLPAPQQNLGRLGNYDVLEPLQNIQKKRKMPTPTTPMKINTNSGAGDIVHHGESYVDVGRKMQKFTQRRPNDLKVVDLVETDVQMADGLDGDSPSLALMRREAHGYSDDGLMAEDEAEEAAAAVVVEQDEDTGTSLPMKRGPPAWWYTTSDYRSILGILPMAASTTHLDDHEAKDNSVAVDQLEVAIIERPIYDVDLPPRLNDNKNWETA